MRKPVNRLEDILSDLESLRADDDPTPWLKRALQEILEILKNMDQCIDERIRAASGGKKRKPEAR